MAEALASCRTKCKQSTCPLQVKKILAEFKALGEHHRELGCASALLHEIRMQVSMKCVAPCHCCTGSAITDPKMFSSPIFSSLASSLTERADMQLCRQKALISYENVRVWRA